MAEYIASSTSAADGADFTLADGASATLNLFSASGGVAGNSYATVHIKTSNSQYIPIGEMSSGRPALNVSGPGTFRVSKQANAAAFGVDKN